MDDAQKMERLREAYSDPAFQARLLQDRNEIEAELHDFLVWMKSMLRPSQKYLDGLEMRVKAVNSFLEKVNRKDFIHVWDLEGDRQAIQQLICHELPDAIGFRINCYFYQDEPVIYSLLEKYAADGGFRNIELDFTVNTTQSNGHRIYKVTGLYFRSGDYVQFELQIKSLIHNMWGEVDHKTIYKSRQYDVHPDARKNITEQVFKVLRASDRQLQTLFNQSYTEGRLVEALFFEMTRGQVEASSGTGVLGRHYTTFFEIFRDRTAVRSYTAVRLQGGEWTKWPCPAFRDDANTEEFVCYLDRDFLPYNVHVLLEIASLLYSFESPDQFKRYMVSEIIGAMAGPEEEALENDAFGEDEAPDEWKQDVRKNMETWFVRRK